MIHHLENQMHVAAKLVLITAIIAAILLAFTEIDMLHAIGSTLATITATQYVTLGRVLRDAREIQE